MTAVQKKALQALYDLWRQEVGDHKMVHKPVTFMHQSEREPFVGWILETITPGCLEEFLGFKFYEQQPEPAHDPDGPLPTAQEVGAWLKTQENAASPGGVCEHDHDGALHYVSILQSLLPAPKGTADGETA